MKAQHLALCGLLSALAVTALLLGGILPLATFCAPVLAMAALLPIQEELGPRAAATAWAAVSLLALMLVSDRETALVFVFFGWYPVLRPRLAALPSRLLRILVRLGSYGLAVSLLYGLVLRLMGLTADLSGASRLANAALLVLGGVTFLILDRALERLSLLWRNKLRRRFFH